MSVGAFDMPICTVVRAYRIRLWLKYESIAYIVITLLVTINRLGVHAYTCIS